MQALGLIETQGLVPAIISADTMLKSANVSLIDKVYVGGGLVSISLEGDVGAVKVAVDAGAAAVRSLGEELLVSEHVIARPDKSIKHILREEDKEVDEVKEIEKVEVKKEVKLEEDSKEIEEDLDEKLEEKDKSENINSNRKNKKDLKNLSKKDLINKNKLEKILKEYEIEDLIGELKKLKVVELRKLARKYEDFGIKGREISNGDKKQLLAEFEKYLKKRKKSNN